MNILSLPCPITERARQLRAHIMIASSRDVARERGTHIAAIQPWRWKNGFAFGVTLRLTFAPGCVIDGSETAIVQTANAVLSILRICNAKKNE